MKRLIGLLAIVTVLFVTPALHVAWSDTGDEISICHVRINFERPNGIVFYIGEVISIPDNDSQGDNPLTAHLAHGDVLAEQALLVNNGQCCSFSVLPNGDIVPGQVD